MWQTGKCCNQKRIQTYEFDNLQQIKSFKYKIIISKSGYILVLKL